MSAPVKPKDDQQVNSSWLPTTPKMKSMPTMSMPKMPMFAMPKELPKFGDPLPLSRVRYSSATCLAPSNICLLIRQRRFWISMMISVPCGFLAAALKLWQNYIDADKMQGVLLDNAAYTGITLLISFLIVFRTQTCFSKFWAGTDLAYQMVGDLYDSCSSLIAFSEGAEADERTVEEFQHLLIRLVSLFSALIFADLRTGGCEPEGVLDIAGVSPKCSHAEARTAYYHFELIDIDGIDPESIRMLEDSGCQPEVALCWIQVLICRANSQKVFGVAPPILTRAFQDLGSAMIHFHEAKKIVEVPFPFPYAVAMQLLLLTHWILSPIIHAQWTEYSAWAFVFSFASTSSLWFFAGVAMELDRPFGKSLFAIDVQSMQAHLNQRLLTLLRTFESKQPSLMASYQRAPGSKALIEPRQRRIRFHKMWESTFSVREDLYGSSGTSEEVPPLRRTCSSKSIQGEVGFVRASSNSSEVLASVQDSEHGIVTDAKENAPDVQNTEQDLKDVNRLRL